MSKLLKQVRNKQGHYDLNISLVNSIANNNFHSLQDVIDYLTRRVKVRNQLCQIPVDTTKSAHEQTKWNWRKLHMEGERYSGAMLIKKLQRGDYNDLQHFACKLQAKAEVMALQMAKNKRKQAEYKTRMKIKYKSVNN